MSHLLKIVRRSSRRTDTHMYTYAVVLAIGTLSRIDTLPDGTPSLDSVITSCSRASSSFRSQ